MATKNEKSKDAKKMKLPKTQSDCGGLKPPKPLPPIKKKDKK